ncbi:MAG: ATP-binding cassette domain-containing protein [Spongiibacteraceae bacterium]|jgi:ATP-binding cassette subfamily F protein uup|nr:ATP-binding cassette domain-containing protein [Spongiibacteraceae bacterium]
MTLLSFQNLFIEFGHQPLLVDAQLTIDSGERIALIGRNGAGKSTLLGILAGTVVPDQGSVQRRSGLRVSQLQQALPDPVDRSVRDVIRDGLAHERSLLERYSALAQQTLDSAKVRELEGLQAEIDACDGWQLEQRVETLLTQLGLPAERTLAELSGGWRRRVALGKALVAQPDLLLLDEPTNHLDISTIEWLENAINSFAGSVVLITHDRSFLQRVATRIVDIDRGRLTSWPGNYANYLRLKDEALAREETENALFDKRLAQEEVWIRQGIKARRTRNEGRVRALEAMRAERSQRIDRQGRAQVSVQRTESSGRKVIEAQGLSHRLGQQLLVDKLDLTIMRGDRIGLIGDNGAGKTTLIKLLLGELTPQEGKVILGTQLSVGYFDQNRERLALDKTVVENIAGGRDAVTINGRDRHIISYLQDFLFSPARARTPVGELSGGECNRVLLARLFAQPHNLLVLDEPTNDLDVEMLEVLEERLVQYDGTLLVVSHDRVFLDNVITSALVFEGDGKISEHVGGYSDWMRYRNRQQAAPSAAVAKPEASRPAPASKPATAKLSYKLQRELDGLPKQIAALEAEILALQEKIADPAFYQQDFATTQPVLQTLDDRQATLDALMERWLELEALQSG